MSRSAARGEEFARVAAELAQVPQPRVVNTIEDLAGISDLDAVYIASPNGLHFDQARILIEAGKHVLIEKTITANAAQLETLLTLAKCRGVVVLEAMRSIHDPGFQRIRELLPELGPLRRAELRLCQFSSRYPRLLSGEQLAIFDPALAAGALTDIGTYCTHAMAALWGRPQRVSAEVQLLETGADGAGTILCGFRDPAKPVVSLQYSKMTSSAEPSSIEGEAATLLVDSITTPRRLKIRQVNGSETEVVVPGQSDGGAAPTNFEYLLTEFHRLVTDPDPDALARYQQHSRDTLAVLDAVRQQCGIRFPDDSW